MFDRILIAIAVVPAVLLLVQIYRADKLEKEPIGLIIRLVVQGMIATFLAMASETAGTFALDLVLEEDTLLYQILDNFIIVALSEEGFKYLLMRRITWNSREFNCQFDGVVYAVCVSLGFALLENIGYVLQYGFTTGIVRAFTAVPGHASFGVFMGAYYGLARRHENFGNHAAGRKCRKLALLVPVLFHGFYDLIAQLDSDICFLIFVVFVIVMFIAASRTVRKMAKSDLFIRARYDFYN